jgi:hypothetical protein
MFRLRQSLIPNMYSFSPQEDTCLLYFLDDMFIKTPVYYTARYERKFESTATAICYCISPSPNLSSTAGCLRLEASDTTHCISIGETSVECNDVTRTSQSPVYCHFLAGAFVPSS